MPTLKISLTDPQRRRGGDPMMLGYGTVVVVVGAFCKHSPGKKKIYIII